jgi:DNA-binding NtrC family response regulator
MLPCEPPKVLIVDDDAHLSRSLSRALTHLGLEVTVANDGESALDQLQGTRFDVLLLDQQMPGMTGLDMLRQASSHPNFPPAILHSAYLDVPTTIAAMRAGVAEVLQKPTPVEELTRCIFRLSVGRAALPVSPDARLLLGESSAMQQLRDSVRRIARFRDMAVLIEGPTGTGKELVARSIHALSTPNEPWVSVNCAAIPAELFESELFGHDAGAFSGARAARVGLLEEAGRGVLFFDEVGELPAALQPKLLRVLETREFRRVGGNRVRRFEARVVSATNRTLADEPAQVFRSDLFFRISGYTVRTPQLRDRVGDIAQFVEHFAQGFCTSNDLVSVQFTQDAIDALCAFEWPGNVRQLRAVVETAVVYAESSMIGRDEVLSALGRAAPSVRATSDAYAMRSLPDIERDLIRNAYVDARENLTKAARELGIPRTTLRDRLKRYGLR